ncbi:MAG: family 10 glycosylhydrolase [bacterium]|nr:family 10 glycosylhydrolase [bacterium]
MALVCTFALACGVEVTTQPETTLPAVSAGPPATAPATRETPASARYRGLWVLCEGSRRVLEDPERIDVLIQDAQALGASDLFVQVFRGGRAWFRSEQADATPWREILEAQGEDPLSLLITRAHSAGLRVHAWVNVLSLSRNREAPILAELGRAAVHVDRKGRSILDYPASLDLPQPDAQWYRAGTPGIYLDPAAPGVSDKLVAIFEELVRNYPALDGLHLDYIRHPGVLPFVPGSRFGVGLDYGYGEASRLRFRRETGVPGPYWNEEDPDPSKLRNANRWDAWRREKVTELVARIGRSTSALQPELRLSAAVIAYVDRAYLSLAQDWRRWVEDGLVDFAVPMIYSKDDRLFRYQVEAFAGGEHASRIWAGVGVWLFESDPVRARRQVEIARSVDLGGDALFSYDALFQARAQAADSSGQDHLFTVLATPPAPSPAAAQ